MYVYVYVICETKGRLKIYCEIRQMLVSLSHCLDPHDEDALDVQDSLRSRTQSSPESELWSRTDTMQHYEALCRGDDVQNVKSRRVSLRSPAICGP